MAKNEKLIEKFDQELLQQKDDRENIDTFIGTDGIVVKLVPIRE
jgi:hypothetical protein